MLPTGIIYFAVTLFVALAALSQWKHRRDLNAERVSRGLRGYVAGNAAGHSAPEETPRENPIPV